MIADVRIRPARTGDLPAIRDIVERAYGIYVELIGGRPAPMDADYGEALRLGRLEVADDGRVVGVLVLVAEPNHLLVENVAVDPGRQGAGIGRLLLAHAEAVARRRGLPAMRLYTHVKMTRNIEIYERLGYRECERRSEHGFERVLMAKRLA